MQSMFVKICFQYLLLCHDEIFTKISVMKKGSFLFLPFPKSDEKCLVDHLFLQDDSPTELKCWLLWTKELVSTELKNYPHLLLNATFQTKWQIFVQLYQSVVSCLVQCIQKWHNDLACRAPPMPYFIKSSVLYFMHCIQFFNEFIHHNCKLTLFFQKIAPLIIHAIMNNQ